MIAIYLVLVFIINVYYLYVYCMLISHVCFFI